ncbi:argonaute-like protein [Perkinsela sp. CCAP 1560/4]|nr:argonaute-like protein [Perkinsela sp. CCAP 1560/4]|eukprot:KNH05736.1 argonaute-like protein [Perkinsela sp. CCAP 1560/4]
MLAKSFWNHPVEPKSLHEVISSHQKDRSLDSKLKWLGYKNIPSAGVVSNVFRILLNPKQTLLRYDVKVIYHSPLNKALRKSSTRLDMPAKKSTPVLAGKRNNQMLSLQCVIGRFLRQENFSLPYMFVYDRLYSMGELPESLLTLPSGMLDLKMKKCSLNLVQKNVPLLDFPLPELQRFSNQMIKWCVRLHEERNGNYYLARESNGKVVQSGTGISVNGIRIFRGIQSQMVFVSNSRQGDIELLTVLPSAPSSKLLETLSVTDTIETLRFDLQITQKLTSSKLSISTNYLARDGSGTVQLTVFNRDLSTAPQFMIGEVYVLTGLRIKAENPKYKKGDFDFYLVWGSRSRLIEVTSQTAAEGKRELSGEFLQPLIPVFPTPSSETENQPERKKFELGLRLDSLCTVAGEDNLFQEVLREFGEPPYPKELSAKILSLFYHLPVVDSLTLKQNHILDVMFPVPTNKTDLFEHLKVSNEYKAQLPQRYVKHLADLHHVAQPVAILTDETIVPIQFLHRGFDMHNNWQNTTVPACSILPARRLSILRQFVRALAEGLALWGMEILSNPMITRNAEVMHPPTKKKLPSPVEEPRLSPPREIIVVSILASGKKKAHLDKKESKSEKYSTNFAKDVRATKSAVVDTIDEAISLVKSIEVKKVCAAIVFILEDWKNQAITDQLFCHTTQKGLIPICCRPCKFKTGYGVWQTQAKRYLYFKTNGNPLCNVNLRGEVPSIGNRMILMIGIDVCHTYEGSTGALVGVLYQGPLKLPVMYPFFWTTSAQRSPASETEGVISAFSTVLQEILNLLTRFQAHLDEIIVMQDGSVFSELTHLKAKVPKGVHFTYMNLHKRTNMRFINSKDGLDVNCPKGSLVNDLTPLAPTEFTATPGVSRPISFFLQSHDCLMSTARTLQIVCRKLAPHWTIGDLQKLCYTLSHVHTLLPSKLPFPAKCAHILAEKAHGAWMSDPSFAYSNIPVSIRHRMWFL